MANNKEKKNEDAGLLGDAGLETETILPKIQQRVVENPNVAFADSTLVMTSKFDVKVYFGVSIPKENGGEVQYHTVMSMSPQLAKALSRSLNKAVSDYERDYMSLKMHDEK